MATTTMLGRLRGWFPNKRAEVLPGGYSAENNYGYTEAQVDEILADKYEIGNRVIRNLLIGHFFIGLTLAYFYDTWLMAIAVGAIAVLMFVICLYTVPYSRFTRYVAGTSLQAFVALHIYQMHGLPEMHFFFFTSQTFMILYYDWKAFWPGTAMIIVQHVLFAALTNLGYVQYFWPESFITFTKQIFHYAIAVAQVVACAIWAHNFRNKRLHEVRQREEVAKLALVAQKTDNSVLITDKDGTILWVNDGYVRTSGYPIEKVMGCRIYALRQGADTDASALQSIYHAIGTGKPYFGEVCCYGADRNYWVSTSITPIFDEEDGSIKGSVIIETDITEKKSLENQLLQAQKLESVGLLAGGVAHDFNNNLTVIMGYAEMASALANPEAKKLIDKIGEAAERSASLTGQLLSFARKQVIEPHVIDISEMISSIRGMIERLITSRIKLTLVQSVEPVYAKIDKIQLQQCILNMVANARDAMPDGGDLVITVSSKGGSAVISVLDTGTGIEAEHLTHIFEPFYTTKPRGRGTGMGLSSCYGVAKQAGGHIGVESQMGQGTTFHLHLPLAQRPVEPSTPDPANEEAVPDGHGAGEVILFADDDQSIRQVAMSALVKQGYTVYEAASGIEALALLDQGVTPSLLVTDVIMAGMVGSDLADKAAARIPGLKILFISGYTDDMISQYGVLKPGVWFLAKPFAPSDLVGKVREVLDTRVLNSVTA